MKLACTHTVIGAVVVLGLGVLLSDSVTALNFGEWSEPVNVGPLVNSPFDDISPHVSKNGLSLYFASTRNTGSFGGEDIWISSRATGDDPAGKRGHAFGRWALHASIQNGRLSPVCRPSVLPSAVMERKNVIHTAMCARFRRPSGGSNPRR